MGLIYVAGSFLCLVGFVAFGAIGVDNWTRGNRYFAAFALFVAGACILLSNGSLNAAEQAYIETIREADHG